jgi:hypothetical protein
VADRHRLGGLARAAALAPEQRREIASNAARSRWKGTPKVPTKMGYIVLAMEVYVPRWIETAEQGTFSHKSYGGETPIGRILDIVRTAAADVVTNGGMVTIESDGERVKITQRAKVEE